MVLALALAFDIALGLALAAGVPEATPGPLPQNTAMPAWSASLMREPAAPERVTGLSFASSKVPVTLLPRDGKLRPVLEIHGRFQRPGWTLAAEQTVLVPGESLGAEFRLVVYLKARLAEINFTASGPAGEVEHEKIIVLAPEAHEFQISGTFGELLVSAGFANFIYFQSDFGRFTVTSLAGTLDYVSPTWKARYTLLGRLSYTIGAFAPSEGGYSPSVFQLGADASYALTTDPARKLRFSALAGLGYLTLLANGSPFGFSNLLTPEVGLRATQVTSARTSLLAEARYAPLSGVFSFQQRTVEALLGGSLRLENLHRLQLTVGVSDTTYLPDGVRTVSSTLLGLRLGYTL